MLKKNSRASEIRSPYITPQGWQALEDELNYLWREKRPEVTQAVSEAAAMGDRSENAEYIYGKRQLREIDKRIRFLRKRIEQLIVVDKPPADQSRVYFGAWIDVANRQGEYFKYRIVGSDEIALSQGWISVDAPLAKALMQKQMGDEVAVSLPGGRVYLTIIAISYEFNSCGAN